MFIDPVTGHPIPPDRYSPGSPQPGYPQPGHPPPGYPAGPYPLQYGWRPSPPTNGMAIASMVLGILWLYWLGSVLAVIFGYVARRQIRRTGEGGDGLAMAGLVLGWIGVGLLVVGLVVLGVRAV